MNVEITQASIDEKTLLQRMMQFYSYDFSEFDDSDLDSHGNYDYPYLDHYWVEKGYYPFIVRVDEKLAGFVLVNRRCYLPDREWVIAEFFIMRKYRGKGVGKQVAFHVFDQFYGKWEVHEIERNKPAHQFWRKVISDYTHNQFTETHWEAEEYSGPIQCFDNTMRV